MEIDGNYVNHEDSNKRGGKHGTARNNCDAIIQFDDSQSAGTAGQTLVIKHEARRCQFINR